MVRTQKKIVIANWKMNPDSVKEARALARAVRAEVAAAKSVEVVIAPPAPYIGEVQSALGGKKIRLGAQDVFWEKGGAYTGEVSPLMLKGMGVSYVVIGHSERRALGESDEDIAKKVKAVVASGMTAVLCVGERDRDAAGKYLGFVEKQLSSALKDIPRAKLGLIHIAYEPIWAISTTVNAHVATPEDVHEMTLFIQKTLVHLYDRTAAAQVAVLYGGSVHPKNIGDLTARGEVTGFLVGGSSLRPKDFGIIVKKVHDHKPR